MIELHALEILKLIIVRKIFNGVTIVIAFPCVIDSSARWHSICLTLGFLNPRCMFKLLF